MTNEHKLPFIQERNNQKYLVVAEQVDVTRYVIQTIEANDKNFITASGQISLDGFTSVVGYEKAWLFKLKEANLIPRLYVIREIDDSGRGYDQFVCGLDVMKDGYWLGKNSVTYPTMKELVAAFEELMDKTIDHFQISLEESLPM